MSKLPRKYSKSDGRRAELALGMVEKSTSPNSQMPEIHLNASFQKEEGTLSPKTFWIIVSGGEAREKDYLKLYPNKLISIGLNSNSLPTQTSYRLKVCLIRPVIGTKGIEAAGTKKASPTDFIWFPMSIILWLN